MCTAFIPSWNPGPSWSISSCDPVTVQPVCVRACIHCSRSRLDILIARAVQIHCLLQVIHVPFPYSSQMSRTLSEDMVWIFLQIVSISCQSHWVSRSQWLFDYKGRERELDADQFWLQSPFSDCNVNPWQNWAETQKWLMCSSLVSVTSLSTLCFTWVLTIISHVAVD